MSFRLDIEQNLPPPIIVLANLMINVPLHRVGDFYDEKTGPGCGMLCIWNGGGYYRDHFVCGETYPSGRTFYCCSDCHHKIGTSQKVFLSYRWCDSEIADKIAASMRGAGIEIIRDINETGFLDTISSFMNTAAESRYFIAVVSESYFYSRYCMYEFCKVAESTQPIRTIPVMLGSTATAPGVEVRLGEYWDRRLDELRREMDGIPSRYTDYLRPELNLLAGIRKNIEDFYRLWREEERPSGSDWLTMNCRYLVGAIKITFTPTEVEAKNWTYSNKIVRGARAKDAPPGATWQPSPFYLHAHSDTEARSVTRLSGTRELLLGVHYDGPARVVLAPGVHLALISTMALKSLTFCVRLLELLDRADITLVPMFLDMHLRVPYSEIALLRYWQNTTQGLVPGRHREEVEAMLTRFGGMVERLRDAVVRSADATFAEPAAMN